MTYRLRNIGIAIALAVVAALLTTFYVTNYKRSVQTGEENVTVFVASRDIPAGTSGDEVAERKWLASREVARRNVVPGAISEPSQIEELTAAEPLYAGEQVSTRRFRPVEEQGIQGQLKGNLRALQVPGDEHQLLLGTLKTGDRVDVLGTWKFPDEGSQVFVSRVLLRDVLVLKAPSAGKVDSKIASSSGGAYSAMLALTDRQSHKLFWIMKNGEWTLDLRSRSDAADSVESMDTPVSLLRDGLSRGQFRKGFGRSGR